MTHWPTLYVRKVPHTQPEPSFNIQNPTGTFSPRSVVQYWWPFITTIVTISVQPGLMPLLKSGGQYQFSTWCPGHAVLLNSYFLYFCTSTNLRACFVAPLIIILHTCVVHFLVPRPFSKISFLRMLYWSSLYATTTARNLVQHNRNLTTTDSSCRSGNSRYICVGVFVVFPDSAFLRQWSGGCT